MNLYHNIVVYCKAVLSNLYLINFIGGREDHIHHSDVIYTTAGVIQSTSFVIRLGSVPVAHFRATLFVFWYSILVMYSL